MSWLNFWCHDIEFFHVHTMLRLWNINAATLNFNVMTLLFFSILLTSVDVVTFDPDVATLMLCFGTFSRCHDIGYPILQHSSFGVATLLSCCYGSEGDVTTFFS